MIPGSISRTSVRVTLLPIRRLVKDLTAQVWEPLTAGPLTDHQSRAQAPTTQLCALQEEKRMLWSHWIASDKFSFLSLKNNFLIKFYHGTGPGKSLGRTKLIYQNSYVRETGALYLNGGQCLLSDSPSPVLSAYMGILASGGGYNYLPYFTDGTTELKRG